MTCILYSKQLALHGYNYMMYGNFTKSQVSSKLYNQSTKDDSEYRQQSFFHFSFIHAQMQQPETTVASKNSEMDLLDHSR